MTVRPAGHDAEALVGQGLGQPPRVGDDLDLVLLELGPQRLSEADGLRGDHMHQRAALLAGEHARVQGLGVGGLAHHHSAARSPQGLVGRGGREIRQSHGRGIDARRDEARIMRDVGSEQGADLVGDRLQARPVDDARVVRGAHEDDLRLALAGVPRRLIVVDQLVVLAHVDGDDLVVLPGEVHRVAVGEVPAVGEVEAHHRVAGLQHAQVHRHVRLRAGVGLDVDVLRAEELLGAVDGQVFGDVHELAAAVVALAGVALGVLVGQERALRLEDRFGGVVLRGDQFQVVGLAPRLEGEGGVEFGVQVSECSGHGFVS